MICRQIYKHTSSQVGVAARRPAAARSASRRGCLVGRGAPRQSARCSGVGPTEGGDRVAGPSAPVPQATPGGAPYLLEGLPMAARGDVAASLGREVGKR